MNDRGHDDEAGRPWMTGGEICDLRILLSSACVFADFDFGFDFDFDFDVVFDVGFDFDFGFGDCEGE